MLDTAKRQGPLPRAEIREAIAYLREPRLVDGDVVRQDVPTGRRLEDNTLVGQADGVAAVPVEPGRRVPQVHGQPPGPSGGVRGKAQLAAHLDRACLRCP